MGTILLKAEKYKEQGVCAIEAAVLIFKELKTIRYRDIRILVDIAYI